MAKAYDELFQSGLDLNAIDTDGFMEAYAKMALAASMYDQGLWETAHEDLMAALDPRFDAFGNLIPATRQSPPVGYYLDRHDGIDYQNGRYTTNKYTEEHFDPEVYLEQKQLNAAGYTDKFGNPLTEDGIFGPNTQWVADTVKGTVPNLTYNDPLQSDWTNVIYLKENKIRQKTKEPYYKYQLRDANTNHRLFEVDQHKLKNAKGTYEENVPHINVETNEIAPKYQKKFANSLNEKRISKTTYNRFHTFDNVVGVTRKVGKAMAVVSVVLDVFELGGAIYCDLNDGDGRIGQTTLRTAVGIGGSWGGAAFGAQLGSAGGAIIGSLLLPGLGTVIGGFLGGLFGGAIGANAGREFGERVIDLTYQGY